MAPATRIDSVIYCSFCRKSQKKVKKMIAGPGVYICDECIALCDQIIFRETGLRARDGRQYFSEYIDRQLEALTDDELLQRLEPAAAAIDEAEEQVRRQVRVLRDRGVTWARIGEALGVSRQAAWERFSGEE